MGHAHRGTAPAVLGWDIGGANLKAVWLPAVSPKPDAIRTVHRPFPLWKQPDKLADALAQIASQLPPAALWAVTMTGELCDCYPTKRQGVTAIVEAVQQVASDIPLRVWSTTGEFLTPAAACAQPLRVAAANWHALATVAGRRWAAHGPALLCDIGSTTTDLIPLLDGCPCPSGWTDWERLQSGELVYRGVRRTPLCVLMPERTCAEWFATTVDLFLIMEQLPEDITATDTADGRPATRPYAYARLARLFGADSDTMHPDALRRRAAQLLQRLEQELCQAVLLIYQQESFARWPQTVLLAGSGEFLAQRLFLRLAEQHHQPQPQLISLAQQLGPALSTVATAWAVAVLAGTTTNNIPKIELRPQSN